MMFPSVCVCPRDCFVTRREGEGRRRRGENKNGGNEVGWRNGRRVTEMEMEMR